MIVVHYLDNSRAHRVLWLLEEMGLPYEVQSYQRDPGMQAPVSLKRIHPLGKSPVIDDDGTVVAESGAIFDYLLDHYGDRGLRPATGTPERRRFSYWLHYAEGSAMPLLVMKLVFSKLPRQSPWFLRSLVSMIVRGVNRRLLDPQLRDHTALWNAELSRDGWFAGQNFSAADIIMSFPIEAGISRMSYDGDTAAIRRYMADIRQRPAYRRALDTGGAYSYSQAAAE